MNNERVDILGAKNLCFIVKVSSYIAQCPILGISQSALHFTSLADLFTQTPSQLLWEASSHMLQWMHEDCSYTYPPLSIARYSFIQLSERRQKSEKHAQGLNTAAQDLNPGPLSSESEALPWATALYKFILFSPYTFMMSRLDHVHTSIDLT